MKQKKVTAKEVAERAGVSTTTVSMILNGGNEGKFPEETCRRVIAACKELGYVRKITIKESASSKVLAAIVPSFTNLSYIHSLEAMQQRAKELGYTLLTFNSFREVSQEAAIIKICSQFPIAGIIVLYPLEDDTLPQLVDFEKPLMYHCDKGVYSHANVLEIDGHRMGRLIGEHLYHLGHRRIAFVTSTFNTKQTTRIRRLEGLQEVWESYGLDPNESVRVYTPDTELFDNRGPKEGHALGFEIAKQVIQRGDDVTAFVTINDMIAVGLMDGILASGKRVPEDYSVCGCDNTDLSQYDHISLTSVENYIRQTGRQIVDILVEKITDPQENSEKPTGITRLEYFPKLMVRNSTGPARR